jgi:hypothetical protein
MAVTTAGLWCKILHPMGHPVTFAVLWDTIKRAICVYFVPRNIYSFHIGHKAYCGFLVGGYQHGRTCCAHLSFIINQEKLW